MNPFLDKDQPILWALLLTISSWSFSNYTDSLRTDATLYVNSSKTSDGKCDTYSYDFENLSAKNGILNLSVALATNTPLPQSPCGGPDWESAQCLSFEPHKDPVSVDNVSLRVTFPIIYPERTCSVLVRIPKEIPAMTIFFKEMQSTERSDDINTKLELNTIGERIRIITKYNSEIFLLRNGRAIYFWISAFVAIFMGFWMLAAIVKALCSKSSESHKTSPSGEER